MYSSDQLAVQYLNAIWNVVNFKEAEKRFTEVGE
jgi:superoxide dismutase